MKLDIILAGVGGQGILSIAYVIDNTALAHGWRFKQAEVHGMSQRGGAVQSHLRVAQDPINSDLIPQGRADLILGVEPMETLRYLNFLQKDGWVITSTNPFININNYPDVDTVLAQIEALPNHVLLDTSALANYAGNRRADNMVTLGAAYHLLPFPKADIEQFITQLFSAKGDKIIAMNIKAFNVGIAASTFYREALAAGIQPVVVRKLTRYIEPGTVEPGALAIWKEIFANDGAVILSALAAVNEFIPGTKEMAAAVRDALALGEEQLKSIFLR